MSHEHSDHTLDSALHGIRDLFSKYTVMPNEHCATVLALWATHTWVADCFYTTPRLVLSSPVPGSGKTRILELLELACCSPTQTMNISTAALFRMIAAFHEKEATPPTLLFDETDAVFGSHPSAQAEELRGILNAGYKAGGKVIRTTGENFTPKAFPVFAPVALAGLSGHMPRTITTRAIVVEMRKRAPNEKVAPYRERRAKNEIADVTAFLHEWATTAKEALREAEPALPAGVEDRSAEVWEPLVAVADMAGGEWGMKARDACAHFVFDTQQKTPTIGVELLADIRTVMGHGVEARYRKVDRIRTMELLGLLRGLEESPWSTFTGGETITPRRLGQLLGDFQVSSVPVKDGGETFKGYVLWSTAKQVGLYDAWNRYLDPLPLSPESVTAGTPVTPQVRGGKSGNPNEAVTDTGRLPCSSGNRPVSVTDPKTVTENMPLTSTVTAVPAVTAFQEGGRGSGEQQALEETILDCLNEEYPMSDQTVRQSVKAPDRDHVPGILNALVSDGRAHRNAQGRYLRTPQKGTAA